MSLERVSDAIVDQVALLGIGEIDGGVKSQVARLYGDSFAQTIFSPRELDKQLQAGYEYLHSPQRELLHLRMGQMLAMVGMPASSLAAAWISTYSGQSATFELPVSMFGQETIIEKKVQTMRNGAHGERRSPYEHTTFIAHQKPDQGDKRILHVPGVRTIRKMGVDDLQQLGDVARGKTDLVGVRYFTQEELEGVRLLSLFTDKQYKRAGIGEELAWVYRNYPIIMERVQPRHAGIGLRATISNGGDFWKLVHHGIRQWGDILFVLNATRKTEFQMMSAFIKARTLKAAVQGVGKVARAELLRR